MPAEKIEQQPPTADDPPAIWTPRTIDVGGRPMRVACRPGTDSSRPPLLLVNGIGGQLDIWEPLVRQLDGREIIAFDAPGTGGSARTRMPKRLDALAAVVVDLLDALGHEQVDVLGVSFGGALSQHLARRHPERVRRLILCAISSGVLGAPPRPLAALFLMTPARYYHPTLARYMLPRIVGGRTARDAAVLEEQTAPRLERAPDAIGYLWQLYALAGWTSAPWLHRISLPTLVIAGDDDPVIPLANARFLARRIPAARLRVVEGGGHLFLLDEPESVVDDIHAFLDD